MDKFSKKQQIFGLILLLVSCLLHKPLTNETKECAPITHMNQMDSTQIEVQPHNEIHPHREKMFVNFSKKDIHRLGNVTRFLNFGQMNSWYCFAEWPNYTILIWSSLARECVLNYIFFLFAIFAHSSSFHEPVVNSHGQIALDDSNFIS